MTKQQAHWAETHDWWQATLKNWDGTCEIITRDDMGGDDITFTDFDELYNWAGY